MIPIKWINNPTEEEVEERVPQADGTADMVTQKKVMKDHWFHHAVEGTPLIKLNPGNAQFERRLSGPFTN